MVEAIRHHSALGLVGAWLWGLMAFFGVLLVVFALGMINERDDWIVASVLLVVFVILPMALAAAAYRRRSPDVSIPLLISGLIWPLLLYWTVVYG
jgi:hypothetical protein